METARATHPAQLAVLVPYLLGFHPERSLVVLGLEGRRLGLTQRVDLAPAVIAPDVVRQVVATAARSGAGAVAVVAFEDDEGESAPMRAELRRLVRSGAVRCDTVVVVRDGRWFDPEGAVRGSRPEGAPLPEPSRVPAVATFVGQGRVPLPTRAGLRDLVAPGTDPRSTEVSAALEGVVAGDLDVTARAGALRESLRAPDETGPVTVARALVGLRDVLWRDAVLAALCPGWLADDAVGAGCAGVARAAVEGLDPGSVLERLGAFVRLTPRVEAAPGLTVLAQAAWARGEGAIASVALEEALAVDPCYRLAQLLDRLVAAGVRMPSDAA